MSNVLQAGAQAPEFSLPATADQKISLKDFKGKNVILLFYPADFSPVCSDEVSVFNEVLPELKKLNAELIGISVDNCWCHNAFAEKRKIHFPLLSDFEPKGAVAKKYGAYQEKSGICERALFLIDKNGKIAWSYVSPTGENPGVDGVLEALENLEGAKNSR